MGIVLPPLSVLLKDALREYAQPPTAPQQTPNSMQHFVEPVFVEPVRKPEPKSFRGADLAKKCKEDVTLFPRRKAGQAPQEGGRGPVVLSVELLEQFYGMPLHLAAKKLVSETDSFIPILQILSSFEQGICQTAIKKVCRRLGIKKWPYKDTRIPSRKGESSCHSGPSSPDNVATTSASEYSHRPDAAYLPLNICALMTPAEPPAKDMQEVSAIRALLSLKTDADASQRDPFLCTELLLHPRDHGHCTAW